MHTRVNRSAPWRQWLAPMAALAALLPAALPARATTTQFTVLSGGAKVGQLVVDSRGADVTVQYQIVNNGRGPHFTEHLVLGDGGRPIEWQVDGTTAFFGAVHERFKWESGTASWQSQADRGVAHPAGLPLYVADDASPWALEVYARVLLRQPDHSLDVLPTGTLRITELRRLTVGARASATPIVVYALTGLDLSPKIIMLDRRGRLFAHVGRDPGGPPYLIVRQGHEADYLTLHKLAVELGEEREHQLQVSLAHHFDAPIRIRNVRLFDPVAERLTGLTSVVVFADKIVSVEPEPLTAPPSAREVQIDGGGDTLLPGLHDMHSHTTSETGPLYLAAGVTSTRDMGNDNEVLTHLMQRAAAGEIPSPHIVRNGLLEGISPYSVQNGLRPDSLEHALEDVRWYSDHGYWQIKIYNSMTPSWVAPIAAEAHRLGMRVTGHIPAFMTADQVIGDGYDELTHANLLILSWVLGPGEDTRTPLRITALSRAANLDLSSEKVRGTIDLMKSHHTPLDPTAVIIERLLLSRAGAVQEADQPILDHMPIGYQRSRKRSLVPIADAAADTAYRKSFEKILELLKLLHGEGIRLLPGTDDYIGMSLHRELELYVKAGIAPAQVLRMATLDCERYLNRDQQLGSIERGKLADLILVAGDPTQNISAVRQVRMTMLGGIVYFPAEIYQALSVRPFGSIPPVTPAKGAPL